MQPAYVELVDSLVQFLILHFVDIAIFNLIDQGECHQIFFGLLVEIIFCGNV